MQTKTFFISLCFMAAASANSLSDLKKETQAPLYFTLPVTSYTISSKQSCSGQKECMVDLSVKLASSDITVITDRPVQKEIKITINEFEKFAENQKQPLVFSLSVPASGTVSLYNFTQDKMTVDANQKTIQFSAQMNNTDDSLSNKLTDQTTLTGDEAVLNVEG